MYKFKTKLIKVKKTKKNKIYKFKTKLPKFKLKKRYKFKSNE